MPLRQSSFPLDETVKPLRNLPPWTLRGFDAVYSYGSYEGTLRGTGPLVQKYSGVRAPGADVWKGFWTKRYRARQVLT